MPELPEVEIIRQELRARVRGKPIRRVEFRWPRVAALPSAEEMEQRLPGHTIVDVGRRGKYLIFHLAPADVLIVHLRMTGQFRVVPPGTEPDKHTHVIITLDDNCLLQYRDQRKFGRFYLVTQAEEIIGHLGPEPLDPEWTPRELANALQHRRAPIKALLLDQRIVAGLGNIYADESLFLAGIHPLRAGNTLTAEEITALHRAIRQVLNEALAARGSTIATYIPPSQRGGEYQKQHRVYHRAGQPCPVCGTPIQRTRVGGRSTHYCPHCQR